MFEVGDNIVFMDNTSWLNTEHGFKVRVKVIDQLKLYSIYKIIHITGDWILIEGASSRLYEKSRFISILEYRKLKLKEICSKLEKK